jgi:CRISPR system Cascade subunit CasD
MATLLLRLAAPLQAWGEDSKFETRKTNREPTKSGVVGLLAAALGLKRDQKEELERLAQLRLGVRVEREGSLLVDFHTAKTQKKGISYITYRHYLEDAVFLVGLESEDTALLRMLAEAVTHPEFPLYLGRRSCPPTLPLCLGIREAELEGVLKDEPALCAEKAASHRILIETRAQDLRAGLQKDVPISYDPRHRQYGYRSVREMIVRREEELPEITKHDPFGEL